MTADTRPARPAGGRAQGSDSNVVWGHPQKLERALDGYPVSAGKRQKPLAADYPVAVGKTTTVVNPVGNYPGRVIATLEEALAIKAAREKDTSSRG